MKMTLKKLLALTTVMVMVLSLAACGGSGSGSESGSGEAPAEPNAGVADIVFSLPEAWTWSSATLDNMK